MIFLRIASDYDNGSAFQVGAFLLYFCTLPLIWMVREPVDSIVYEGNESPNREVQSLFHKHRVSVPHQFENYNKRLKMQKDSGSNSRIFGDNTAKMGSKKISLDFEINPVSSLSFRDEHDLSAISHRKLAEDRSEAAVGFMQFRSWSKTD